MTKNENDLGADAAAVDTAGSRASDLLSRAELRLARDRSELFGFTHRGFKEQTVNQVIDNYRDAVIEYVLAHILARAAVDTVTVKPGMWFAAGYIRHRLIENGFQPVSEASGSVPSEAQKS